MINHIDIQGKIEGKVTTLLAYEKADADFVLAVGLWRFQVMCPCRMIEGFKNGDKVTISGMLKSTQWETVIYADSVELRKKTPNPHKTIQQSM